jgi:hypothetical protein
VDDVSVEALDALRAAIRGLLPTQPDLTLQPAIHIQPTSITTTGLNGFVGMHDNPVGEILGRRVEATVVIDLKAATAADADDVVSAAITALVAADRATLLSQGLLRLALVKVGDRLSAQGAPVTQEVTVTVLYEYLKLPTDPEDTIQQIPLNIALQQ